MKMIYKKLISLCIMLSIVSIIGSITNPEMRIKMLIVLFASVIGAIVAFILMKNENE